MSNPSSEALPGAPLPLPRYRSKSIAAWLALLGGSLGLHRFYLHGFRDGLAWAHGLPTLLGWMGLQRLQNLGQDDRLAWLLLPVLGLMLSLGAMFAILYGLTTDEKWDKSYNPGQPGRSTTWAPVLAAVAALLVGGGVFMGTITYGVQMFFEWEMEKQAEQQKTAQEPREQPINS
jgi:hypothetical protein